ncbi:hypothetical protein B566_EDAN002140 [Ephemera danica]|nr:hypothetical protein B566_EDAN002140 [Ephemera danica]
MISSPKQPGIEGRWDQIIDRTEHPLPLPGSFISENEGTLPAFFSYIGRTWIKNSIVPCRIYTDFSTCATAWDLKEERHELYEILIGNYVWKWTNSSTPIPDNALIGGYREIPGSNNREILYVGRAIHDAFEANNHKPNKLLPGHVSSDTRELIHIAWNNSQRKSIYQILVKE